MDKPLFNLVTLKEAEALRTEWFNNKENKLWHK